MTQAVTTKETPSVKNTATEKSVIFIDWDQSVDTFESGTLFDKTDFTKHDLVFVDLYQFALKNGLRTKDKEFKVAEYIDLDENQFINYLKRSKIVAEKFKAVLKNDGTLVFRSGIPKGHIKVRKRTSASIRAYTESVLSTFFWMDEVLGKSTFQDCVTKFLNYPDRNAPLFEVFGNCVVESRQAQISIGRGYRQVIATGGPTGKLPLVTKVSLSPEPGQIYFIPRFMVEDEQQKLITALTMLKDIAEPDYSKPTWLDYYEKQITDQNPLSQDIDLIDAQIEALTKQRIVLTQKISEGAILPELLWEKGPRLRQAVQSAFKYLGLELKVLEHLQEEVTIEGPIEDEHYQKLIIKAFDPAAETISVNIVENFLTKLSDRPKHPKPKAIIIGNGQCLLPPEKRTDWFDRAGILAARKQEVCLLTVLDLYTIAALVLARTGSDSQALIKKSLVKDLFATEGLFELNRSKYGL